MPFFTFSSVFHTLSDLLSNLTSFFLTLYSFFLWMTHFFIHLTIHSICCGKIFIQKIFIFSGKRYSNSKYHSFKIMLFYSFNKIIHFFEKVVYRTGLVQGGAGRRTGLSARRARRTKSRGYSRPTQTMADQSILKSAVLPASPMPLFRYINADLHN